MSGYIQYTDYTSLLVYLQNEYPYGSIGWERVNNGLDEIGWENPGMQNEFLLDSINRIPGYHAVPTNDGRVRLTYQSSSYPYTSPSQSAATATNSNASIGTNSAGKTQTYQVPAHAETNPQTGTTQIKNNLNGTTTTKFLTKEVIPAVAAAGVGISLGKKFDQALYDANPDFWDSHGMATLNPNTWSSITDNMSDSIPEVFAATMFNMVFGIKPNNTVNAYLDEQAFAYLALYEQTLGLFDYPYEIEPPEGSTITQPFYIYDGTGITAFFNDTSWEFITLSFSQSVRLAQRNIHSYDFASQTPFEYTTRHGDGPPTTHQSEHKVVNGKDVYFGGYSAPWDSASPQLGISTAQTDDFHYLMAYSTVASDEPYPGVGTQENASLPQLNNQMTVEQALAALKEQYPELWEQAELSPQLQSDGSIKNNVYIPVAIPQAKSATDTQPKGDGQASSQTKPYYDQVSDGYQAFQWPWGIIDPTKPDVPTDEDDDNDKGGGDTPVPIIPTGTAEALWKIYNPSQSQLNTFGGWLWSSNFVDQLLKLFNDPMQAIIGLHKIFVTPPTSGSGPIKVGYLVSDASANYVSAQYTSIDCGQVDLEEFFGNVFDYSPYTSIRLYLPFIGIVDLDNEDIMRASVGVKYTVDVLTGACLAEVKVLRDGSGGTLYTFSGNCAVQYPVSSGSYVGIVTGLLGIAGTLATGSAVPAVLGAGASIGRMHADVKHSGNISANAGAMGIKKPYIIIERPQTAMPINGVNIEGLPNNKTTPLSACKGHVKVKKCHFDGISCTGSELERIEELLENGIFIN